MSIENIILDHLKTYKKKTIPTSQLENLLTGNDSYESFANSVENLMDLGILKPVKSHGTNGKSFPLYNTYRIIKSDLRETINNEIQLVSLKVNPNIHLDSYFSLDEKEWHKDLPYIKRIDDYLKKNGLPTNYISIPERSFQLIGDEKWIDEKGGKRILERIKLWDKLKITTNPEPLMMAVNPSGFMNHTHIHLVVENKATFYALMESVKDTDFTSIIYGGGWKIVSNLHMLPIQLGLKENSHKIYYFGDIDGEGISIWYSLYEKYNIELAISFYEALFEKEYSIGKETQQKKMKAIEKFKSLFSEKEVDIVDELFKKEGYLPQEALKKEELIYIWRNSSWTFP